MYKKKYINALLTAPLIFSVSIVCETLCFIPLGWTADLFNFWGSFSWILKHLFITIVLVTTLYIIKKFSKTTVDYYIYSSFLVFPILLISTQFGYKHLWFCPNKCESIALILLPAVFISCAFICGFIFGIIVYLFSLNKRKILIPIFICSLLTSVYLVVEKKIMMRNYMILNITNNNYIELPFIKDITHLEELDKSKACNIDSPFWEELFRDYIRKNKKNNSISINDKSLWVNNCLNIKRSYFGLEHRGSFIAENCLIFAASYYNDKGICKYSNSRGCSCYVDIANSDVEDFGKNPSKSFSNNCKEYKESFIKSVTKVPPLTNN